MTRQQVCALACSWDPALRRSGPAQRSTARSTGAAAWCGQCCVAGHTSPLPRQTWRCADPEGQLSWHDKRSMKLTEFEERLQAERAVKARPLLAGGQHTHPPTLCLRLCTPQISRKNKVLLGALPVGRLRAAAAAVRAAAGGQPGVIRQPMALALPGSLASRPARGLHASSAAHWCMPCCCCRVSRHHPGGRLFRLLQVTGRCWCIQQRLPAHARCACCSCSGCPQPVHVVCRGHHRCCACRQCVTAHARCGCGRCTCLHHLPAHHVSAQSARHADRACERLGALSHVWAARSPAFNLASNDQWHKLAPGVHPLTTYTGYFWSIPAAWPSLRLPGTCLPVVRCRVIWMSPACVCAHTWLQPPQTA